MDALEAIQIVEGEQPTDDQTYFAAWQKLIDDGVVWVLQGHYGRTARDLINSGKCRPSREGEH